MPCCLPSVTLEGAKFVFTDPFKGLTLCLYWMFVISASVLRFYNISKHSKIERIFLRKYYHLVAVLMFLPALLCQPVFLDLAFGAAFGVFLVLAKIRSLYSLKVYCGSRDVNCEYNIKVLCCSQQHIWNHFSLLLGCALPIWMSSRMNDRPLAPFAFAGIFSLGIGDTMASVVGHKHGVLRWSKTGTLVIIAHGSHSQRFVGGVHSTT